MNTLVNKFGILYFSLLIFIYFMITALITLSPISLSMIEEHVERRDKDATGK